jgi:hypothetical protein
MRVGVALHSPWPGRAFHVVVYVEGLAEVLSKGM